MIVLNIKYTAQIEKQGVIYLLRRSVTLSVDHEKKWTASVKTFAYKKISKKEEITCENKIKL